MLPRLDISPFEHPIQFSQFWNPSRGKLEDANSFTQNLAGNLNSYYKQDIDFFKNLCHFLKRSRYCKRRAYHLYQRRSHYYLYWVPVQREQDIDFLKNLCHFWKRSRYCKRRAYPYIKEKVTTIYIEYLPKEKDTYLSHYGPLHVKVNKKT